MTDKEVNEFNRIEKVKNTIKELIKQDSDMILKRQNGRGKKGTRYEKCQWIDVRFKSDSHKAASILFYEDAIIDIRTGNLHPGRYGYVVFQKWSNRDFERTAPNLRIKVGRIPGIFIPIDDKHREETQICVLDGDVNQISNEIYNEFNNYTKGD